MITKKALLMVDIQNDFCTGGALGIPGGEAIIPLINRLQSKVDIVVATKDWHPLDHSSFESLWPVHCVQGTKGAELHADLDMNGVHHVVHKGRHQAVDSYSAFYDNDHIHSTGLSDYLREVQVTDVYVVGLATDYCVKFSALDAVKEGFRVYLVEEACRGVELQAGDIEQAVKEMKAAGVKVVTPEEV